MLGQLEEASKHKFRDLTAAAFWPCLCPALADVEAWSLQVRPLRKNLHYKDKLTHSHP